MAEADIFIGTAGWSIPADVRNRVGANGTALERYASVFPCVEINSSFYRRHRPDTWQRWHDAVPETFRFAVKVPKLITHELKLAETAAELDIFRADIVPLRAKLGPLLVQLPPKLGFNAARDGAFFTEIRRRFAGRVVIEPRHGSWATAAATELLGVHGIDRVYADPQLPELRAAVDMSGFAYLRLHGAPKVYYSAYSSEALGDLQVLMAAADQGAWCIFDNTASGAALRNALDLQALAKA